MDGVSKNSEPGNNHLAVLTSEQLFTRFMQQLPGLAWIKDAAGRYVFVNEAAARSFGFPAEELLGKTDDEVFPAATAAQFKENDRQAIARSSGIQTVETLEIEKGNVRHSIVSKFPILGPREEGAMVGGMAIDITDRLRAEQALKEADRHKDEFLAMLAHELRNPLAPIQSAIFIMQHPESDEATVQAAQEIAVRQVEHMSRLLEDLLDVSRISRGKIELRLEDLDLAVVTGRAVESVRPLINARQHTLRVSVPARPLMVTGDAARLEQVLTNLLHNAAKYTDPGGDITFTVACEGNDATLRVRDTGIGLEPSMLTRIFELFVQAERRVDRSMGGVGIGLTLVRKLVELHGGTVEAASEGPGRGSEFIVRLPLHPSALEAPETKQRHEQLPKLPSHRILVVDDNVDAANTLAMLLRLAHQEVRAVYSGPSALEEAAVFRPEVVILDIGMPGMDGYEVARGLRQMAGGKDLLLIAVTGWGQQEDRDRSTAAGFDHHLLKPVDRNTLFELLTANPRGWRTVANS